MGEERRRGERAASEREERQSCLDATVLRMYRVADEGDTTMQWDEIKRTWKTQAKAFQKRWSKLTDLDLEEIDGKRDVLLQRLQKLYKTELPKLEKEVDDFTKTLMKTAKV